MSEKISTLVPGEAFVPKKPWLRKIGGRVVRYARNMNNWNILNFTGQLDGNNSTARTDGVLQKIGEKLEAELDILSAYGMPVVEHHTKVGWVPVFNRKAEAVEYRRGLIIDSDFVSGTTLDLYMPRNTNESVSVSPKLENIYTALGRYLSQKEKTGGLVMSDIFDPEQYMVGTTVSAPVPEPRLIDLDPRMSSVNPTTLALLRNDLIVLRQLTSTD
jgi:hypothetical protein